MAAYTLTLTPCERRAIDWVGHRDWNGADLYYLLWVESSQTPDDADWDDPRDITFHIPENVAWNIRDLYEDNDRVVPHFTDEMAGKIVAFIDSIV